MMVKKPVPLVKKFRFMFRVGPDEYDADPIAATERALKLALEEIPRQLREDEDCRLSQDGDIIDWQNNSPHRLQGGYWSWQEEKVPKFMMGLPPEKMECVFQEFEAAVAKAIVDAAPGDSLDWLLNRALRGLPPDKAAALEGRSDDHIVRGMKVITRLRPDFLTHPPNEPDPEPPEQPESDGRVVDIRRQGIKPRD
jgi:hypothetical protein